MPELPEVETIARGLDKRVRSSTILSLWLGEKPEPLRSTADEIERILLGSTIRRVHRVGKHLVLDLERPSQRRRSGRAVYAERWHGQWLIHLGMTGRVIVCEPDTPIAPHTHAIAELDGGRQVRFIDPRRFGRLSVVEYAGPASLSQSGASAGAFAGPGQEPLQISSADFRSLFRGRHTPIKSALLNQKLLHGVGNIYADESLFRAGIRPRRQAARLKGSELDRLRSSLRSVLEQAIELGGSSVSDYVDAAGERGFFQLEHRVYGRAGKPCLACGTPIRRIVIGGRGTHFCPRCQR